MSFGNHIPGVAHAKASTQIVLNDEEGGERTMETFQTPTQEPDIVSDLMAGIARMAVDDEIVKKEEEGNKTAGGNAEAATTVGEAEATAATGGEAEATAATGGEAEPTAATGRGEAEATAATGGGKAEATAAIGGEAEATAAIGGEAEATAAIGGEAEVAPTENTPNWADIVLECQREFTEICVDIHKFIRCTAVKQWDEADRQSQKNFFFKIHKTVEKLISNGHSVAIERNSKLVISSHDDSWKQVIDYPVGDSLDVHHQVIGQQFSLDTVSSCPTVLSAEFQESELRLTRQVDHCQNPTTSPTKVIYGIRCRLCDPRCGPGNISYVGKTDKGIHERVCSGHKYTVGKMIKNPNNIAKKRAKSAEVLYRPMYEHAAGHFKKGHVPQGTKLHNVFREVMETILLPISGDEQSLRSWECFWQFFLHCRIFCLGWNQR